MVYTGNYTGETRRANLHQHWTAWWDIVLYVKCEQQGHRSQTKKKVKSQLDRAKNFVSIINIINFQIFVCVSIHVPKAIPGKQQRIVTMCRIIYWNTYKTHSCLWYKWHECSILRTKLDDLEYLVPYTSQRTRKLSKQRRGPVKHKQWSHPKTY